MNNSNITFYVNIFDCDHGSCHVRAYDLVILATNIFGRGLGEGWGGGTGCRFVSFFILYHNNMHSQM